jgi:hypothetical protein
MGLESEKMTVDFCSCAERNVPRLAGSWGPLTVVINRKNRNMGQPDIDPFVISTPVVVKLQFIHDASHEDVEPRVMPCAFW